MSRVGRNRIPAGQRRLFEAEDLRVVAAVETRLRHLAITVPRAATPREIREDQDRATVRRLRTWGRELARRFRLRPLAIEAEQDGVNEHYGICYLDGMIRIRLRHAVTGRLLKESSLVDTLCHELAHLRHFDHSKRFWKFYRRILVEARKLDYYRPGPETSWPRQGTLFGVPESTTALSRRRKA